LIIADRKLLKTALELENDAKKLARLLASSKANLSSQVYGLLEGQPLHLLLFLLVNYPQAKIQNRIKSYLFKFPVARARMPRAELLTLGLEAGPKFEKIFHQLFLAHLDGKIKTHPQLLKEFRALAGIKEPVPPKPAPPKPSPKPAKPAAASPAKKSAPPPPPTPAKLAPPKKAKGPAAKPSKQRKK
jgi:hypothetical protein